MATDNARQPAPDYADSPAGRLEQVIDDVPSNETAPQHERSQDVADADLNTVRIRQLAALRRGAYRSRSHAVIASVVCAVCATQLLMMAYSELRSSGVSTRPILLLSAIPLAIVGCVHFYRRALALHREIRQKPAHAPAAAPDFAGLGNGADQWKRLDDMR